MDAAGSFRVERDSFGEVNVPRDKYYGAQTMRSVRNFPIGDPLSERMPLPVIQGMGVLKKAAAEVNREFGLADEVAEAVREHLNKYFQKLPPYITKKGILNSFRLKS